MYIQSILSLASLLIHVSWLPSSGGSKVGVFFSIERGRVDGIDPENCLLYFLFLFKVPLV